jgi:triacylglycerol esterase/lipase EstA (alpha/beta hydrolase family)
LSKVTAILLGTAILFAALYVLTAASVALIASGSLLWVGGLRILNALALRTPLLFIARTIHWAHAMTFEFFAFAGVALLRFLPSRKVVSGKGKPILLVHGYVNSGSVWTFLKKRLEKAGFGPIYTINLGHPFRSIQEYARKVQTEAEAIAAETGRKDLILIGHSMGGLVSALYALSLSSPGTVTDVITIGSPLAGTLMARLGIGPNAREMERDSTLIRDLQAAMAKNQHIRFHHIATKSDQLVIPGHSAVILANNHFILEDLGHASLLYSRRVTDKIAEWLKETLNAKRPFSSD